MYLVGFGIYPQVLLRDPYTPDVLIHDFQNVSYKRPVLQTDCEDSYLRSTELFAIRGK